MKAYITNTFHFVSRITLHIVCVVSMSFVTTRMIFLFSRTTSSKKHSRAFTSSLLWRMEADVEGALTENVKRGEPRSSVERIQLDVKGQCA